MGPLGNRQNGGREDRREGPREGREGRGGHGFPPIEGHRRGEARRRSRGSSRQGSQDRSDEDDRSRLEGSPRTAETSIPAAEVRWAEAGQEPTGERVAGTQTAAVHREGRLPRRPGEAEAEPCGEDSQSNLRKYRWVGGTKRNEHRDKAWGRGRLALL